MATAKVFWSGNSQAVRLPKEFRVEGDECTIRREGNTIILEPTARREWSQGFWECLGSLDDDVCRPVPMRQEREDLD